MSATKDFRQRYWARSMLGFPVMMEAKPNTSHFAIQTLLEMNPKNSLITQNVDGLHVKAGSSCVEMHGTLHFVECQNCNEKIDRSHLQNILYEMNPEIYKWSLSNPSKIGFDVSSSLKVNPDGDSEVTWDYSDFNFPHCSKCKDGILKPSVVFFGENIKQKVRDKTFDLVDQSDVLVVIGSSLAVYSSLRLVKRAAMQKKPVIILNHGETRGDGLAFAKIDSKCNDILQDWIR